LVVSIIGILLSLSGLFLLVTLIITGPLVSEFNALQIDQFFAIAWIIVLVILLTIPSLILSIRRLRGIPSRQVSVKFFLFASLGLILLPLLIWAGIRTVEQQAPVWQTAPINSLLALIPIAWFAALGLFKLGSVSWQRLWGLSNFSIYLSLPLVVLVEIILLGFGIASAVLWAIQQPEFAPLVMQIQHWMMVDPSQLSNLTFDFLPVMQKPEVIFAVVAGVTVIIPLVEELLKPLGLWFLVKKEPSPAQGFAAGLICGASFALLESAFSLSAAPIDGWMITAAGRVGTGLLHIVTAGLNGWALASSWKDGKAFRIGLIYILTVIIHGIWNFFALIMGISQVGDELSISIAPLLAHSAAWVLAGLAVLLLAVLIIMNRRLRAAELPPLVPPVVPNSNRHEELE
jgi:hypothetical protein